MQLSSQPFDTVYICSILADNISLHREQQLQMAVFLFYKMSVAVRHINPIRYSREVYFPVSLHVK
jgi:hypothetical protein